MIKEFLASTSSRAWFAPVVILASIIIIYAQTLSFGYIYLDEEDHIVNRQYFLTKVSNIPEIFSHDTYYPTRASAFYRPLQTLSFMGDALVWGSKPIGYHITNVILHSIASLLVMLFLTRLNYVRSTALMGALFFALHPLASRAVAWVPGRNDSLLAIFVLAAMISLLGALRNRTRRSWLWHAVWVFLALLTKETAVVVPILAGMIWFYIDRESIRKGWQALVGWLVGFGLWTAMRDRALLAIQKPNFWRSLGFLFKNSVGLAVLALLGKTVFPFHLSVLPTNDAWSIGIGVAALLVLSIPFILARRRPSPLFVIGAAWFLLTLLPSLISNESEFRVTFFEHRAYLPLVGSFIMLAELPWHLVGERLLKHRTSLRVAVLVVFAILSFIAVRDFQNGKVYWEKAVRQSPGLARSFDGLGNYYASQNQLDAAIVQYQKALQVHPDEKRIRNDLGVAYLKQKKITDAEMMFVKELTTNPNYVPARHNLAFTYAIEQKYREAEEQWVIALSLDPSYMLAHQGLAILYLITQQFDPAMEHIRALEELGAPLLPELKKAREQYEAGTLTSE